jgi:F0F1-type ATP synthase assembly protein I
MTVPAAALIGFAIGYEIDGHMGGGHTFTVIFVLLGCAAGMVEIVRTVGRDKSA